MRDLSLIKTRDQLPELFAQMGFQTGVEVGVERGRFSEKLCEANPDLGLFCVDPWFPYKGNRRGGGSERQNQSLKQAQETLKRFPNVTLIRELSMDAVKRFEDNSLDFVYIDGNHDFDYVMQDIIEWSKKVRPGGIVAGHDYYHFHHSGVIEAVDTYILAHGIRQWYLTTDDKTPSFFWIKQDQEIGKRIKDW